jgi:hypothetical protein
LKTTHIHSIVVGDVSKGEMLESKAKVSFSAL